MPTLAPFVAPLAVSAPAPLPDGRHDFDFLHGTWHVRNRRLRAPLTGSTEWYEFDGRAVERPLLGGQANLEEYDATLPDGTAIHAVAMRLYEPATRRWTIHWSNAATGTLDAPLVGTFRDGVGEFLSHEDYQGRMILVRFRWTSAPPDAARWEQAFSADGGRTWEPNWIMEFTRDAAPVACCPIVELRHYVLHPGQRETLIELFDREFVDPLEAAGMQVIGEYRDIDRPDVFTWLRGFPDMEARAASLGAFYDGPVWQRWRGIANPTMISSDDVRLMRPVRAGAGLATSAERAPRGATAIPDGLVVATIYTLAARAVPEFAAAFERDAVPRLVAAGARPIAMLETAPVTNTWPRLPVREGEHAFVWFARYADVDAHARAVAALRADARWTDDVEPALARRFSAPVETWRLTPTARSRTLR